MASMLKNYVMNEGIMMETASCLKSVELNHHFQMYLPKESIVVKSMNFYLKPLYADFKDMAHTLYDINVHAVTELRGYIIHHYKLTFKSFNFLINECMVDIIENETDCLLLLLWKDYVSHKRRLKRDHEQLFAGYLNDVFSDQIRYSVYQVLINRIEDAELKVIFQNDFDFIVSYFSVPPDHISRYCEYVLR